MPRYFFHVREGHKLVPDEDGIVLPDLDAVRREAREGARGMMREWDDLPGRLDGQCFEITDETNQVVLVYPFRDAL